MQTKLCVKMRGNTTILLNEDNAGPHQKEREFVFDFSFWSHDQFKSDSEGYNIPDGPNSPYHDQKHVYQKLGVSVLDNAWLGYHCSLFAYGQTGAGKSYSVMGYKPNIGIVPMACNEIFERIE